MRVLHYPEFDRLEIRDLDVTPPQPDEVRIQVAACGLCGSELETFKNRSPRRAPPLTHRTTQQSSQCPSTNLLW